MPATLAPTLEAAKRIADGFIAAGYTLAQSRPNGYVLRQGTTILAIKVQP